MGMRARHRQRGPTTSLLDVDAMWRELVVRPGSHRLLVLSVAGGGPRRDRLVSEVAQHLGPTDLAATAGRREVAVLLCEASDHAAERFVARIVESWTALGGRGLTARITPMDSQTPEPSWQRMPALVG